MTSSTVNFPAQTINDEIFERRESVVRSYCRAFPATFATASGCYLFSADGRRYLDFLSGAGSLNYGHNPEFIKRALIDYLEADGLASGLDLATTAKRDFLETLDQMILSPRGLSYRVQFCGPSGTNAVEAALKLARLATGRTNVISFHGGFHGVSTGSLSVTGSSFHKHGLYDSLPHGTHIPYPDSPLGTFDSLDLLDRLTADTSSGVERPAAVILETIQGEGGVYVAPPDFLVALRQWCTDHDVLLIVDDIQAGCGRSGYFFSFERAGIQPDLVTLSKSIGGYGLPMALLLISPDLDTWRPGQHNGTFRGNQLAFVAAAAAIRQHWSSGVDDGLAAEVRRKQGLIASHLDKHITEPFGLAARGMGMIWGIDCRSLPDGAAESLSQRCFSRGLVVETCGRNGEVVKLLPPLTLPDDALQDGLEIVVDAVYDEFRDVQGARGSGTR